MADTTGNPPLLEAHELVKQFGTFTALAGVEFSVHAGEVHALLGENGAGKSTLMNVLSGLLRPTSGRLQMGGTTVRFTSPSDAESAGIGMVHQHFLLVPTLSVRENLLLGAPRGLGGPLSYPANKAVEEAQTLADRLGWRIPWEAAAGSLPVGTQQRIEILKALRGTTRVLIFDEPTAVLTPTETPELFATIRQLAAEGRGIVFISHKLSEVLELANRVTVLRRGAVVFTTRVQDTDATRLAQAMVGADSEAATLLAREADGTNAHDAGKAAPGAVVLQVAGLQVNRPERGAKPALADITFTVRAGEVFGIAGVDGNGQAELAECLVGLRTPDAGQVQIGRESVRSKPGCFRRAGVASIPADRQTRGLALPLSITENMALGVYDKPEFRVGPLLRWGALRARANDLIKRFDIRATGAQSSVGSLSGGNQQKVVIARALAENPQVVVAVNPTRGLDVGAIAFVYDALRAAKARGAAIVLISTELEEVRTLSDRVGVLFDGRFTGIVEPDAPREQFGLLMGGQIAGSAGAKR